MSGNKIQIGAVDGAIRIKENGIVVAGDADPCCCANPDVLCDGETYKTFYDVTIGGLPTKWAMANGVWRVEFQDAGSCASGIDPGSCFSSPCWWQVCYGPVRIWDTVVGDTGVDAALAIMLYEIEGVYYVKIQVDDSCISPLANVTSTKATIVGDYTYSSSQDGGIFWVVKDGELFGKTGDDPTVIAVNVAEAA